MVPQPIILHWCLHTFKKQPFDSLPQKLTLFPPLCSSRRVLSTPATHLAPLLLSALTTALAASRLCQSLMPSVRSSCLSLLTPPASLASWFCPL